MSHLNLVQPWAAQLSVLSSSVSDLVTGQLQTELVEQVNHTENLLLKEKKKVVRQAGLHLVKLFMFPT